MLAKTDAQLLQAPADDDLYSQYKKLIFQTEGSIDIVGQVLQ